MKSHRISNRRRGSSVSMGSASAPVICGGWHRASVPVLHRQLAVCCRPCSTAGWTNCSGAGHRLARARASPRAHSCRHVPRHWNSLHQQLKRAHEFALLARASLTSDSMEQVYDDVSQLARIYSQRPLPEILGRLVTVQDTLFKFIETGQAPACARQLYFLAGVTCGLLARAAHDLGDPYAAMTQARTGFICADRADHNGLRAAIRAWQAIFTYWADRPHDAVRYSQSGTRFASAARSTTLVWVPAIEARAWAQLGNDGRAYELLQHAERMRDQVRPDELDEIGGVCTFDRSRQLYVTADALAWLPRRARLCRRYCEEAVAAYQDSMAPTWSFAFQAGSCASLAIARICMGEMDGAAEAMASVFELAAPQRINLVVKSVRRVHSVLSNSPLAGIHPELTEKIRVFADSQLPPGSATDCPKPLSPRTSPPHPRSAMAATAAIGAS